jgi:predicted nucleic acid-binding protein
MRIIDSCGWLEYFLGGPLGPTFRAHVQQDDVMVPTVVLFEVYKVIKRDVSERKAEEAIVQMKTRRCVPLTDDVALLAADLALEHRLAMGDAFVLASAQVHDATLITSDFHFADMPGVEYLAGTDTPAPQ